MPRVCARNFVVFVTRRRIDYRGIVTLVIAIGTAFVSHPSCARRHSNRSFTVSNPSSELAGDFLYFRVHFSQHPRSCDVQECNIADR